MAYRESITCIVNGSPDVLVVLGGADDNDKTFNDGLWILNVNDIHWTKVCNYS